MISSISRRRDRRLPPRDVRRPANIVARRGGQHRARRARRSSLERAPRAAARPAGAAKLRPRRSSSRRRRRSASSARTPSSTTSASARPGIARTDRRRFAASILDAILGGSASSRLFQEIREKRGMAYSVYTFASQYTDTGQFGVYVGTREENLAACLEIAAEQIARGRGREAAPERARAREGEPEGADRAVDGVDVEPDEPARQVADHRHGAALGRPDHRRDRGRRGRRGRRARAACCSRRSGCRPRASARARSGSARRSSAVNPALLAAQRREGPPQRARREGRDGARPGARGRRSRARRGRVDGRPRRSSTSRGPSGRRERRGGARGRRPVRRRHDRAGTPRRSTRGARGAGCRSSSRRTSRSARC